MYRHSPTNGGSIMAVYPDGEINRKGMDIDEYKLLELGGNKYVRIKFKFTKFFNVGI